MNRYNHYNTYTTRGYIYRTLGTVLSIVVLAFFMPRGNQIKIDFKKGKPWNYGTIIAKENFPILKPEEVLDQERDSLLRMYKPIYDMNTDRGDLQVSTFKATFDDKLQGTIPPYYRPYLVSKLRHIYDTGIMSTDDY